MNKPIMSPRPRNQNVWTKDKLDKAVAMFMSGFECEEIAKDSELKEFSANAIGHKLRMNGFTKEFRKNKLK